MNLGSCWQSDVWADGSWINNAWCPEAPCIPESIGECWQVVWCSGSWQNNVWCPAPIPPAPVVRVEDRKWPGPSIVLYREGETDTRWLRKLKKEDEEYFIL